VEIVYLIVLPQQKHSNRTCQTFLVSFRYTGVRAQVGVIKPGHFIGGLIRSFRQNRFKYWHVSALWCGVLWSLSMCVCLVCSLSVCVLSPQNTHSLSVYSGTLPGLMAALSCVYWLVHAPQVCSLTQPQSLISLTGEAAYKPAANHTRSTVRCKNYYYLHVIYM